MKDAFVRAEKELAARAEAVLALIPADQEVVLEIPPGGLWSMEPLPEKDGQYRSLMRFRGTFAIRDRVPTRAAYAEALDAPAWAE